MQAADLSGELRDEGISLCSRITLFVTCRSAANFLGDLGPVTALGPFPLWAIISDIPTGHRPVGWASGGPYLAIEPIERHGGIGRPQHAHGGRGHVREDGSVSLPPFLVLRARVRVRALRPPRRLHGQVSGQVRAPPCSEQPQAALSTSRPTPLRPEALLHPRRDAGRGPKRAPAPAAESDAPPSRAPEPSHSIRKGRPPVTHDGRSRETCSVSRYQSGARRCLGYQAAGEATPGVALLRRPGCQVTGKFAFCFRTVPPTWFRSDLSNSLLGKRLTRLRAHPSSLGVVSPAFLNGISFVSTEWPPTAAVPRSFYPRFSGRPPAPCRAGPGAGVTCPGKLFWGDDPQPLEQSRHFLSPREWASPAPTPPS